MVKYSKCQLKTISSAPSTTPFLHNLLLKWKHYTQLALLKSNQKLMSEVKLCLVGWEAISPQMQVVLHTGNPTNTSRAQFILNEDLKTKFPPPFFFPFPLYFPFPFNFPSSCFKQTARNKISKRKIHDEPCDLQHRSNNITFTNELQEKSVFHIKYRSIF